MSYLKNYSSGVPADVTYDRIEALLRKAGAKEVSRRIEDGWTIAISFRLPGGKLFRIPIYPGRVYDMLYSVTKRPSHETRAGLRAQAQRTALKLTEDWLALHLSYLPIHRQTLAEALALYAIDEEAE